MVKKSSAPDIQKLILDKKFTFEDIFCIYHQLKQLNNNEHNALTEVLWAHPLQRAKELDLEFQKAVDKKAFFQQYPFAGYVFSIKDSNKLKDTVCTNGFIINLGMPYTENPKSIDKLIAQGALITCKGNVPQALFAMESFNNIFGETKNPYDPSRISGGSSGGEACLVRLGLVNIAIGSDVAGSLRLPALCCGVSAFKPTAFRISNDQLVGYFDLHEWNKKKKPRGGIIKATVGPISKTVFELEHFMKHTVENSKYDKSVPLIPWKEESVPKKIGFLKPVKEVPLSASAERAYKMAIDACRGKNVEVVEIDIQDFLEDFIQAIVAAFLKNEQLE